MAVAGLWFQRSGGERAIARQEIGGDCVGSEKKSGTAGALVRIGFFPLIERLNRLV